MRDAIPGWSSADPGSTGDRARRPIGDIVREVFRVYGGHFEPIIILAALIEGTAALISLPYIVVTIRAVLAGLDAMGDVVRDPTSEQAVQAVSAAFDRFRDPLLAGYGGVVSVAPLASALLLSGALGAYLVSGDPETRTPVIALRMVVRRWAPLLLPAILLAVLAGSFTVWSYGVSGASFGRVSSTADLDRFGLSFVVSLLAPVVVFVALYLSVRWMVAVPALVVEGLGLRLALARSASLTYRRRLHIGLCLLVVGIVWSLFGWLVFGPAFLMAGVIEAGGGGPLLAVPLALYVIGRIVFAPLIPILTVILYRDLRAAGPAASTPGIDDKAAPPGWGSVG